MAIPKEVQTTLVSDTWRRSDIQAVETVLSNLGISNVCDFANFYRRYCGPFHGQVVGYDLLDLVEQDECILSNTNVAQSEFDLSKKYLVVSNLLGGAVLVYDIESEAVYDVDFEGGDQVLISGEFPPRWKSWTSFLIEYFL